MTTEPKHTPTPWKGKHQGKFLSTEWAAKKEGRARGGCTTAVPIKAGKQTIALVVSEGWDDTELEANAEFIIRACNSHDALYMAAKTMAGYFNALESGELDYLDLKGFWIARKSDIDAAIEAAQVQS